MFFYEHWAGFCPNCAPNELLDDLGQPVGLCSLIYKMEKPVLEELEGTFQVKTL